jgi:methionyl-tRNA formyltransferase
MLHTARRAKSAGLRVAAILAPRHAEERLPLGGEVTLPAFRALGIPVFVVPDLNDARDLLKGEWTGLDALAFCFGAAWIFKPEVLRAFGAGMVNYNPIPVPRYLGGAHYTWQILNGDRSGGCILQLITKRLDRGAILRARYFRIPAVARTPADYFLAYHRPGCELMDGALKDIMAGRRFKLKDYESLNARRLYLPRLNTLRNGYIDWRWSGAEIERFCCAFDRPYAGAGSFIDGVEIRLGDVRLEKETKFHPFLSGLIVRRLGDRVWIAVDGGTLRVGSLRAEGADVKALAREGRRFATPTDKLHEAAAYRPQLSGTKAG